MLKLVDQGSILLVVYTAFSEAVIEGLWQQVLAAGAGRPAGGLRRAAGARAGPARPGQPRALGFSREDEITIVFCGSKKSLASGVPMAKVLFAPTRARHDRAAADAVPPDPADGVRGAGAALCAPVSRQAETVVPAQAETRETYLLAPALASRAARNSRPATSSASRSNRPGRARSRTAAPGRARMPANVHSGRNSSDGW